MPQSRTYSGGSIIYFQGDKDVEEVYVLKSGRVVLLSTSVDTGEEIKEDVQIGEFFGVKSSLGHYSREETAQVFGKTQIIVFTMAEFEQFVLKNTRLIMKMLRVFSKQLRSIHRQVRDILKVGAVKDPSYELMNVAESFYKNGNFQHAEYAFNKYIEYYPTGKFAARAKELVEYAQKEVEFPSTFDSLEDVGRVPSASPASSGNGSSQDEFAFDDSSLEEESAVDCLNAGIQYFKNGEYSDALKHFQQSLAKVGPDDPRTAEHALFERARAELKLGKLDDAAASFTTYAKTHADGEYLKDSIYQIGVISEAKGNKERARALYLKVATMSPPDSTNAEAKKRLEKLR